MLSYSSGVLFILYKLILKSSLKNILATIVGIQKNICEAIVGVIYQNLSNYFGPLEASWSQNSGLFETVPKYNAEI